MYNLYIVIGTNRENEKLNIKIYEKSGLLAHKVGMEVYTRGSELIDFILTREGNPNLYTNEKRKNRKRK